MCRGNNKKEGKGKEKTRRIQEKEKRKQREIRKNLKREIVNQ